MVPDGTDVNRGVARFAASTNLGELLFDGSVVQPP